MAQVNLSTKQKQTQQHRKQTVVAKGGGDWRGKDWDLGISRCKLLSIGWIDNRSYRIAQGTVFNILE